MYYYNSNGVKSNNPIPDNFWIKKIACSEYVFKEYDLSIEIENICHYLYSKLKNHIFGDNNIYNKNLLHFIENNIWVQNAGIDSESSLSKNEFEKKIRELDNNSHKEIYYKFLYFYDVSNLIATLQNINLEVKFTIGFFYEEFNENDFLIGNTCINSIGLGLQNASGIHVTKVVMALNHIFILFYSILDVTTKILFEFKNLEKDFFSYKKLKSNKILYGDVNKIKITNVSKSIYNKTDYIKLIINLRNDIVHNLSFDNLPKIYQITENNLIIDKYILLADTIDGSFETFLNRKRFYSKDTFINEIIPKIYFELLTRVKITIEENI